MSWWENYSNILLRFDLVPVALLEHYFLLSTTFFYCNLSFRWLEIYFASYLVIVYLQVLVFLLNGKDLSLSLKKTPVFSKGRPVYLRVWWREADTFSPFWEAIERTHTDLLLFPDCSSVRHQGESEHRASAQPDHRLWLHTGGKKRHPDPIIHCMMRSVWVRQWVSRRCKEYGTVDLHFILLCQLSFLHRRFNSFSLVRLLINWLPNS